MPESHRKHMQRTPGRLLNRGLSIGPGTLASGHRFVLRHAVHGNDVEDAFEAVLIALMHAIHSQVR